jgi:hypothetical protein
MSPNDLKLFVAQMMTEENDKHSKLIADLRNEIEDTQEFENTLKVLSRIHKAKIETLEKIYGVI